MTNRNFPSTRLRRLRKNLNVIDLVSETNLTTKDLIQPIFIKENFRELGLGTKLFEFIIDIANSNNFQIRSFALPSDRQAKNFYESNAITAKVLIMEKKRENNRYRP